MLNPNFDGKSKFCLAIVEAGNPWHPSKIVALNESAVIQGVSIDSGGTDARRYGDSVGG